MALQFGGVRVDAVGHPGPVAAPSQSLEMLDRPAPEALQAERFFVAILRQVRVEAHVEAR